MVVGVWFSSAQEEATARAKNKRVPMPVAKMPKMRRASFMEIVKGEW